ncbi:phosphate ABC transporter substrate-binding protein PstS [Mycobacterium celatum]|uniref:Phosphate-binding protein n=2 Tax=Mycobacterium celatum TaxID=28045 RepID=A0A1X1RLA3_MYCCE|nr:phosphate ABC transporter substrate-binding protein PstS [Mycobacterium celatum]ORV08626.1 phosphate-binding protein [Mycobacterium celatum]PIB78384.1 phosphate ABC transporter substrate-binding protein PstS [Mycobacterium celatum]
MRRKVVCVKVKRCSVAMCLLAASALVFSACGGHHSSTPSSATAVPVQCGGKQKLKASGSTAQKNAIEQFVYAYIRACPGHTLDYDANGSGKGVEQFVSNITDLGGSDKPLDPTKGETDSAQQRCGSPAWDLPAVFGPIAITYNVNNVSSLNLDAPTTAKIFNGGITMWNDPAIAGLNKGTNLPATPINVVFRSDKSGTTYNFQSYLDAASDGAWGKGASETFNGGVGQGAVGNDGTSLALKSTDGSITYNEWSYAVGHQLNMAQIITSAGPDPVTITTESVGKTIAGARFKGQGNDLVVDTSSFYKPTQSGAYPLVLATYEIVCSKYPDPATGTAVKAFMQATIGSGQEGLDQYGYIPLPSSFQSKLETAVNAIS